MAGAKDLGVLSAIVSACGPLGPKATPARPDDTSVDLHYSVIGLTARADPIKDVHVRWRSIEPLKVGDVLAVKVIETDKPDRPRSRVRSRPTSSRTG